MSLLDSLNIGMRGLHAAQVSIDVTGQNISNANTDGYSRKRVNQQADALANEVFGQNGLGVEITGVMRVRDEFLDRQIWEQTGDKGMFQQLNNAMTRIENILQEPSANGLGAQIEKFWSTWQDLANNPSNLSAREAVKASANVMMDVFHNVYKQIEDYGLSMNNPLAQKAVGLNDLTKQIYLLNEQIAGVEARPGEKANDSRDQRDMLVRKLAELVDIQTVEDAHGRAIITSGGNLLVGPSDALQLETYGVDKTLSDGTTTSELRLRFAGSRKEFSPRSGELKGIMDARGEILTRYMEDLNLLAKNIVETVNAVHETGYNLNKNTGVYFFNPEKIQASDISLSAAVLGSSTNIAAAAGGKIVNPVALNTLTAQVTQNPADNPLVPMVIPAQATGVFDLGQAFPTYSKNLAQGTVEVWIYQRDMTNATTAADPSKAKELRKLEEGAGKDYVVDYEKGIFTFLNYQNFAAGDEISIHTSYNTVGFSGNGNGQNALQVAQLRQKLTMSADPDGVYTQSISSYYAAVVGKLGIQKNQNGSALQTKEFLIAQMDSEQSSLSGVSLDEEMANMIKFENSYKASAKYIATINAMLDVLMNI